MPAVSSTVMYIAVVAVDLEFDSWAGQIGHVSSELHVLSRRYAAKMGGPATRYVLRHNTARSCTVSRLKKN